MAEGTFPSTYTGLTDAELRASAVPVSGTFWQATQPVSIAGTVAVSGPLTDAQLRATPVPVSGTVTATPTGTQDVFLTMSLADNSGFTDGSSRVLASGYIYDEIAGTALTENDVAAARINANRSVVNVLEDGATRGRYAAVTASNALKVDGSAVTQPVSGTFWQATQPVSIAATVGTNIAQVNGVAVNIGTGAASTGTQRVAVASDSSIVLAAGTAGIGKLTANSGVDIGDVDVTSVIAGTGATNLGKAVANAAGATDTGVLALAVRDDALAGLAVANDEYTQLRVDSTGRLWTTAALAAGSASIGTLGPNSGVDIGDVTINNASGASAVNIQDGGNSITVDGSVSLFGTSAINLTQIGGIAVNFGTGTSGAGTPRVTVASDSSIILAAGSASIGTLGANSGVDIGDVTINNASGASAVNIQDGGNSITVDGTVAVSSISTSITPGTAAANLGKAEDGIHNTGDVGVMALAVRTDTPTGRAADGGYIPLITDSVGRLHVAPSNTVVDNAAFTDGTTVLGMAGFVYDATAGTALTENDAAAARIDAKRAQIGVIEDGTTRGYSLVVNPDGSINTREADDSVKTVELAQGSLLEVHGQVVTVPRVANSPSTWNVTAATTSTAVAPAKAYRLGLFIYNDSVANMYLKIGDAASSTSFTVMLPPYGFYELPGPNFYNGTVSAAWSSATGYARVTEIL